MRLQQVYLLQAQQMQLHNTHQQHSMLAEHSMRPQPRPQPHQLLPLTTQLWLSKWSLGLHLCLCLQL